MQEVHKPRVICYGEVLWDILPTGAVPGGAPMNVTYHLQKLDKQPALITRVGKDEKGRELTSIFSDHGVCTDYFQWDDLYPTGMVFAHPGENNEVIYDIVKPVAWDFIELPEGYAELVSKADYFIFGSLACRNERSRQTLQQLLDVAGKRVFDINLRPPHYDQVFIEELLGKTDILKLNHAELELITSWFTDHKSIDDRVKYLSGKFSITTIVVTIGSKGAYLFVNGNIYQHPGFIVEVKDTIGSGDAFLAGLISKFMENEEPGKALAFANAMGAFVASRIGACPVYERGKW